jgi:hypothetical protein
VRFCCPTSTTDAGVPHLIAQRLTRRGRPREEAGASAAAGPGCRGLLDIDHFTVGGDGVAAGGIVDDTMARSADHGVGTSV